jgi:hypothetical protein
VSLIDLKWSMSIIATVSDFAGDAVFVSPLAIVFKLRLGRRVVEQPGQSVDARRALRFAEAFDLGLDHGGEQHRVEGLDQELVAAQAQASTCMPTSVSPDR